MFFEVNKFYSKSISICERSISLTCAQLEIEKIVVEGQSVKNTLDAISVIQFIDVRDVNADID